MASASLAAFGVSSAAAEHFDEHRLVIIFAAIGLVVLISGLVSGLVERGPFSQVLVFVALGVIAGPWGFGILDFSLTSGPVHVVATLSLVLVLFTDGIKVDVAQLRANWLLPAIALGPGTLLTIVLIGFGARWLIGLPWALAFLVATILSSTDAVLLRDVLSDRRLPRAVRHTLTVEAGMNDIIVLPLTLVLATIASSASRGAGGWLRFAVNVYILAPVVGVAVAYVAIRAVGWLRGRQLVRRDYESLYSIGVALTAYAAAELVGGSGFIAAFAAGLTVDALDVELCDCFLEYGETTSEMAMLLTFVFLGGSLVAAAVDAFGPATLLLTAFALLVARPLAFLPFLRRTRLDRPGRLMLAWFGPRGLGSLLLLILAVGAGMPQTDRVYGVVSVVVVASILVHGISATPIMAWYGRHQASAPEPAGTAPPPTEAPRMQPTELRDLIESGTPPVIIDVRREGAVARSGQRIPGAWRLTLDEIPAHLAAIPRNRPIVLYCA